MAKDICSKCGAKYDDILGIGYCGECFSKTKPTKMDNTFQTKLAQNLHLYFGYFYDQNGKKINPNEIVEWFIKNYHPVKSK